MSIKEQLQRYRRKYHRVELIRGIFLWLSVALLTTAVLALGEYFLYLGSTVKTILLILWSAVLLYFLWSLILRPLLAISTGWNSISNREIAIRIGNDNAGVEDKLLNYLELESDSTLNPEYLQKIIAQRTKDLERENFLTSIDTSRWIRAAWWAGVPTVVLFTYGIFAGQSLKEGSSRFFDYRTAYIPKAPFEFISKNEWVVDKGDELVIHLELKGDRIPSSANVIIDGERFPMQSISNGSFEWKLDRVQRSSDIYFEALDYRSDSKFIKVEEVPLLLDFAVTVIPPSYTGISPFEYKGSGDALIPAGSDVKWQTEWQSADVVAKISGSSIDTLIRSAGTWQHNERVFDNASYRIKGINNNGNVFQSGEYVLSVLRDERPTLEVDWSLDTLQSYVYVSGFTSDDYGISSLSIKVKDASGDEEVVPVPLSSGSFSTYFSAKESTVSFSVVSVDNDAVRGGKATVAGPFTLRVMSSSERREELQQKEQQTIQSVQRFQAEQEAAKKLRNEMNQRMIEGTQEWKLNRLRDQLQEQQRDLLREWEEMKESFQQQNEERMLNELNDPELEEKRKQLQELLDEMNTDKLDELLQELEEKGENMNEDNLRDWMKRAEQQNQKMEMDAERMEELMKRLNVEQSLNDVLKKLEELQQRQEDLANRSNDTQEEQDALNEDFEDLMNEMDSLSQDNDELKSPMPLDMPKEDSEEASESMEESSQELQKGNSNNANQQQQQSSESMQKMMQKMSSSVMQMEMEMHVENLENLRRILTNLIHLSVDQEQLMDAENVSVAPDGLVVEWMKEQQDLRLGYQVVNDSLRALIQRVPQVEAAVTDWMVQVESSMDNSNANMSERELLRSNSNMRESMWALNELAVMLDVTMDEMQQQMSGMMQGNQTCQKPGGGKPSMSNMRARQQQLNKMMQQMGNMQGSGKGESEGENGQNQGESQGGQGQNGRSSQQIVEMMQRQSAIREMLREKGSTGNNGDKSLEELLEENERDLANRNFDTEFWDRQKEIEVKMLELEEAERLQEQDEQRESETGDRYQELREKYLQEFIRENQNTREDLRYETPLLTPYYQQRSSSYLRGQ